jgi:hypothetical protein
MVGRIVIATLLSVAACGVGEVPLEGGGGPDGASVDGEASFNAMVMPLITAKGCTVGATCHGGIQQPSLSAFGVLQPRYYTKPGASNILVTKGSLTAGVHQAVPYFDAAEQATVAAWIDSL